MSNKFIGMFLVLLFSCNMIPSTPACAVEPEMINIIYNF